MDNLENKSELSQLPIHLRVIAGTNCRSGEPDRNLPTPPSGNLDRFTRYVRSLVDRIVNWLRGPSDAVNSVEGRTSKANSPKGASGGSGEGASSRETSPPARGVCETLDHDAIMRIVRLPTGVDRNEWIAHHIIALFEHVNALRGSVSEMCTAATCPTMSYSGVAKLPWVDEKGKKHSYSAAQYMDSALTQCEQKCDDALLFPTKHGQPFPSHFAASVSALTRLLWQCIGHLYERHWKHLESLNLVPQAALVFEHLARFSNEFSLLDAVEQKRIDAVVFVVRPPVLEGTVPTPEV